MTGRPQPRLFPMAALVERTDRSSEDHGTRRGLSNLARAAAIHPSQASIAWQGGAGMLTVRQADEWAVRAGYHPWEIWGDLWFDPAAFNEGAAR